MIVLYDGDCGICSAVIAWFATRTHQVEYRSFTSLDAQELEDLGVTNEACATALHVIDGRCVLRGARAMNRLARLAGHPIRLPAMIADNVPPLVWLEELAYRVFASKRHLISAWLGQNACRLN
jgi:predicted DCC family thiol-disulfide oxidoreductase YuxK